MNNSVHVSRYNLKVIPSHGPLSNVVIHIVVVVRNWKNEHVLYYTVFNKIRILEILYKLYEYEDDQICSG